MKIRLSETKINQIVYSYSGETFKVVGIDKKKNKVVILQVSDSSYYNTHTEDIFYNKNPQKN